MTGGLWVAVARLAVALLGNDLAWRYVAEQSRRDAPWYYRLAGVWGGSEGSLLLFAAIVALVATAAARRCVTVLPVGFAAVTVAAFGGVSLLFANPFGSLDVPSLRGFGLTPILEHPAMAIHPPMLYTGLAATLAVAMASLDGRTARSWMRWSLALITTAMAIGALWSYLEQGWGGYWAWDPVENTSLLVWLAVLVALHSSRVGSRRLLIDVAPWVIALAGAALVRSGSTPSIHGFAEQASVGWALLIATAATGSFAAVMWSRRGIRSVDLAVLTEEGRHVGGPRSAGLANVVLAAAALGVIAVGTLAPVVIDIVADRPAAIRGVYFSRVVGPLALVGVPFIALRLRHRRGRLAHLGMLVLLAGIAASTFDRSATFGIADGQVVSAAGLHIVGGGVRVEPGSRADTRAVVVDLLVDDVALHPSLVAYPDRGGVLAETAIATWPWRDVQVTLGDATDDGIALITVRQRPLVWLIWIGAVLTAVGALRPMAGRSHRRADVPASAPATR